MCSFNQNVNHDTSKYKLYVFVCQCVFVCFIDLSMQF